MKNINQYFKSVIDSDCSEIVICDIDHIVIYMNPSALKAHGNIIGNSILSCHNESSVEKIKNVISWFNASVENNRVHTFYNEKKNTDVYMVALRNSKDVLIGYYEKHEQRCRDAAPFYNIQAQ